MNASILTKALLYFIIAAGTAVVQTQMQPTTPWQWFILVTGAIVQGCVAVRALYSETPATLPPGTVETRTRTAPPAEQPKVTIQPNQETKVEQPPPQP